MLNAPSGLGYEHTGKYSNLLPLSFLMMDGVLTDGTVLVLTADWRQEEMNIKDGFALQNGIEERIQGKDYLGGNSPEVMDRLENWGEGMWVCQYSIKRVSRRVYRRQTTEEKNRCCTWAMIYRIFLLWKWWTGLLPGGCGTGSKGNSTVYFSFKRRWYLCVGCNWKSAEAERPLELFGACGVEIGWWMVNGE